MRKYIGLILGMLFLILIINYIDRSAIAYAIQPIKDEFHFNNAEFGFIASAFALGYTIMTVVGGALVDRYRARWVLAISTLLWSLVCIFTGLAASFMMLAVARILLGVTEGPSFPALTQVIARWLPMQSRVRAMSFALASVPLAACFGSPVIAHMIHAFNWRVTYIVLGISGIIMAVLWYKLYRDQPRISTSAAVESNVIKTPLNWRALLKNRALFVNNIAYFAYGYLLFFALTWLPGFLEQTYHVELVQVGWFLSLPWLVGAIMLLFGGQLSDWLFKKTGRLRVARTHVIWVSQFLSAICFIPVIALHSLTIALLFISLGVGFALLPNAIFYSLNIDLAKDHAATSLGVMDAFFGLGGIIAPWLTGWLSHVTNSFNAPIGLMIIITLIAVVSVILFQHPDEQVVN